MNRSELFVFIIVGVAVVYLVFHYFVFKKKKGCCDKACGESADQ